MPIFHRMTFELSKKTSHKNQLLINLALFIVFIVLINNFLLLPTIKDIKKLRVDIANAKIETNKALEKDRNIDNQVDKLKTIESQIEKLDKVFISRGRELEFITTLEGIAYKNNIEQTMNLKDVPDLNTDNFASISVLIKAKGNFNDVMNYLKNLESMAYCVNINDLSINKTSSTGGASFSLDQGVAATNNKNTIIINITADTYFK